MEYLCWYRDVLKVPIENEVSVDHVEPQGDLLRLTLSGAQTGTILTRKLVFATGRDGTGGQIFRGSSKICQAICGPIVLMRSTLPPRHRRRTRCQILE